MSRNNSIAIPEVVQSGRRQSLGRGSIDQSKRSIAVGGCPYGLVILAQHSAIYDSNLCPIRHPPQKIAAGNKEIAENNR